MNARLGSDELRRRRLELGLTRRELARRAAVDLSVIEDTEIHGIAIYDHTASLLAGELGIDTSRVPQPAGSSPSDVEILGAVLADLGTPIATQTIAAATAHVLLAVLRGRRDERSWTKLDDNHQAIATQLVAAGAITEDNGMLAPSEHLAGAFDPGQLFQLDW